MKKSTLILIVAGAICAVAVAVCAAVSVKLTKTAEENEGAVVKCDLFGKLKEKFAKPE